MKRLSIVVLTGFFVTFSFAAAQGMDGMYGSVKLGMSMLSDSDLTATWPGGSGSAELSYDSGLGVSAAIGGLLGCYRVEGELGYHANDWDEWTESSGSEQAKGDTTSLSLMVNGYYDFLIQDSAFTPYVGLGLGMVKVDVSDDEDSWSDDDTVVGYQFMAGVAYAINQQLSLELEYRFVGTQDPEFIDEDVTIESEVSNHNVNIGARIRF